MSLSDHQRIVNLENAVTAVKARVSILETASSLFKLINDLTLRVTKLESAAPPDATGIALLKVELDEIKAMLVQVLGQ
jgi:hypothetical protein